MCSGERDKLMRANGRGHFQQHCKERGRPGSTGERGALLSAGDGCDVQAEQGMLLCASWPSHVRQGKDAVFGKQARFRADSHFFRLSTPLFVLPASPAREEPEAVGPGSAAGRGMICGTPGRGSTRCPAVPAAHGQDEQLARAVHLPHRCHLRGAHCSLHKRMWRG